MFSTTGMKFETICETVCEWFCHFQKVNDNLFFIFYNNKHNTLSKCPGEISPGGFPGR